MLLGSREDLFERDIAATCFAMDAGIWLHANPTDYRGFTFLILRQQPQNGRLIHE